jgi:hypothetical protein
MNYKNIPFGDFEKFNVIIEIPKGSEKELPRTYVRGIADVTVGASTYLFRFISRFISMVFAEQL